MVLGKLCTHIQNNEAECLPKTIYKKISSKWTKEMHLILNTVNLEKQGIKSLTTLT